ncbi:hypothetical protein FRC08_002277 [Ceratobasidium sp. 394]|nr:hypothetical protein FRC08_002277 [Ceratobasidium sp. 394]KAG9081355.1 hypothetical protein FS749_007719 [Ceratobasidium sp. UAMH 11750]
MPKLGWIRGSATVYLDLSNNFVAAVLDTSPKKMKFAAFDLNRDPGETSTDGKTSTGGIDQELSGWMRIRNNPIVAVPGKVDNFTMKLNSKGIWIDIGDEIGPSPPVSVWVDDFHTTNQPQSGRGTWSEV